MTRIKITDRNDGQAMMHMGLQGSTLKKLPVTFAPDCSENAWEQPIKFSTGSKAPDWIVVTSHHRFQHRRLFVPNHRQGPLL